MIKDIMNAVRSTYGDSREGELLERLGFYVFYLTEEDIRPEFEVCFFSEVPGEKYNTYIRPRTDEAKLLIELEGIVEL